MDLGITLFAGEAEGRLEELLRAAYSGELASMYNFMNDLPNLKGEPVPYLPVGVVRRTMGVRTSFDAGRGWPLLTDHQCSGTQAAGTQRGRRRAAGASQRRPRRAQVLYHGR